jgi:hypothetical protein
MIHRAVRKRKIKVTSLHKIEFFVDDCLIPAAALKRKKERIEE